MWLQVHSDTGQNNYIIDTTSTEKKYCGCFTMGPHVLERLHFVCHMSLLVSAFDIDIIELQVQPCFGGTKRKKSVNNRSPHL